jgi:hypothetical protein
VLVLSLRQDKTSKQHDGLISSVALSAKSEADFSVALRDEGSKLETKAKIGTEHSLGRVLAYERRSDADRLSRELAFLSRDAIYEQAIGRAAQLVEAIRGQKT